MRETMLTGLKIDNSPVEVAFASRSGSTGYLGKYRVIGGVTMRIKVKRAPQINFRWRVERATINYLRRLRINPFSLISAEDQTIFDIHREGAHLSIIKGD